MGVYNGTHTGEEVDTLLDKIKNSKSITEATDFNNLKADGRYHWSNSTVSLISNCPYNYAGFMEVKAFGTNCIQKVYPSNGNGFFMRAYYGGSAWQSWYRITGTVV